jgi:hypothetical protein
LAFLKGVGDLRVAERAEGVLQDGNGAWDIGLSRLPLGCVFDLDDEGGSDQRGVLLARVTALVAGLGLLGIFVGQPAASLIPAAKP